MSTRYCVPGAKFSTLMTKFSTLSATFSTPGVLIPRTGTCKIPRLRRQMARIWRGGGGGGLPAPTSLLSSALGDRESDSLQVMYYLTSIFSDCFFLCGFFAASSQGCVPLPGMVGYGATVWDLLPTDLPPRITEHGAPWGSDLPPPELRNMMPGISRITTGIR